MFKCTNCNASIPKFVKKKNELVINDEKVYYCSDQCKDKLEKHYQNKELYKKVTIAKVVIGIVSLIALVAIPDKIGYSQMGVATVAVLSLVFPTAGYSKIRGKSLESYERNSRIYAGVVIALVLTWFVFFINL